MNDQFPKLLVHEPGHLLAVAFWERQLPAQERMFFSTSEIYRADPVTHSPLRNHLLSQRSCLLQVVLRAAADVVKNELFCDPSGEGYTQSVHEVSSRIVMPVFLGKELRDTHCHTAGDYTDLVNRVCPRQFPGGQCMSCLMICCYLFFRIAYGLFSRRSHKDDVFGLLKVVHIYLLFALSQSNECGFVCKILKIRAGHTRSPPRQSLEVDITGHYLTSDMDFNDRLPFLPARPVYHNMPVEPSRPQKGGIQHVRPVCCGNDYHFFMGIKSIHLTQKLVQCLLPFIMSASKPCTACAAYGINLIYKDNTWLGLLCLFKHIPDA